MGSGIGSFSEIIIKDCNELTILEPDKNFCEHLTKKFRHEKKVKEIINGSSHDVSQNKYDPNSVIFDDIFATSLQLMFCFTNTLLLF